MDLYSAITLVFYKNGVGEWYVDIPDWKGDREELQMVMGADTMLDIISEGEERVRIDFSTEKFPGSDLLIKVKAEGSGFWYFMPSWRGIDFNLNLWLCNVTVSVFGEFPENIHFVRHW